MKDDELKTIWKASNERMQSINLPSINLNNMNEQIKKFDRRISRRNTREIIVATIVILIFSILAYNAINPLKKLGSILLIGYAIGVIYFIRKPKKKQPRFDITNSIRTQLLDYQGYVMAERKLLKNILYWYLIPMLPGLILFIMGGDWIWQAKVIYSIFILFTVVIVYNLNQRAVMVNMNHLLDDIDTTLKSLEEEK